mgnify:CR=1 FL=1|jgi:hypothetical protein
MAKLSKEELIKKVSEKVMDEDVQIELMEDITDSMEVENIDTSSGDKTRIEELETQVKELKQKYKDRFLKGSEEKEDKDEKDEDEDVELKEKEVIDIKEI